MLSCWRAFPSIPLSDTRDSDSKDLALQLAEIIDEKQGSEILILDVAQRLAIADFFVIATARNNRHAQALGRELDLTVKHLGYQRRNLAGLSGQSGWVLLDFNTVVVHVFSQESRDFYRLENLWADVPRIPFAPTAKPVQTEEGWLPEPGDSYPDSIGNL